jgi:hypothetical protein
MVVKMRSLTQNPYLLLLCLCSRLHSVVNHESRVLVVPTTFTDVKTCIRQLRNGDRMYIRTVDKTFRTWEGGERGWHSWKGRAFVTNEPLWRERRPMFPYSGAKTVQELDQLYQAQEKFGKDIFSIELTNVKGIGRISVYSDPYVKLSGQIVLW